MNNKHEDFVDIRKTVSVFPEQYVVWNKLDIGIIISFDDNYIKRKSIVTRSIDLSVRSLCYTGSSRPAWDAQQSPVSKQPKFKQQANESNDHNVFLKLNIGNTREAQNHWVPKEVICFYSSVRISRGRRGHFSPQVSWTAKWLCFSAQAAWEPKEVLQWSLSWSISVQILLAWCVWLLLPMSRCWRYRWGGSPVFSVAPRLGPGHVWDMLMASNMMSLPTLLPALTLALGAS